MLLELSTGLGNPSCWLHWPIALLLWSEDDDDDFDGQLSVSDDDGNPFTASLSAQNYIHFALDSLLTVVPTL